MCMRFILSLANLFLRFVEGSLNGQWLANVDYNRVYRCCMLHSFETDFNMMVKGLYNTILITITVTVAVLYLIGIFCGCLLSTNCGSTHIIAKAVSSFCH